MLYSLKKKKNLLNFNRKIKKKSCKEKTNHSPVSINCMSFRLCFSSFIFLVLPIYMLRVS